MPLEQFSDVAYGTVTSGGTTAPASGTSQSWTVATTSVNAFPGASNAAVPPTIFHIADVALPSETVAVTNVSGTTWTVTRGVDGTAPVVHTTGFTIYQVVSAGALSMSQQVYNARSVTYGATGNGSTDDTTALQAALTTCRLAGGGIVYVPEGIYIISQSLQIGSGTTLMGAGMQVTTIRAKAGFAPTQVGGLNGGAVMTATFGNGEGAIQNNIILTGITFDGNQANNPAIPGYANSQESSPCSLWNANNVQIDAVESINSIGYALYVHSITNFSIRNCVIISGQTPSTGYLQQDAIHTTDCSYGVIANNLCDSGTSTVDAGDDGIAVLAYQGATGITITGNTIRAGQSGIDLALASNGSTPVLITNITITGNTIWSAVQNGVVLSVFQWFAGNLISDVTVSGNSFTAIGTGNNYSCGGFSTQNYVNTSTYWKNVSVTGNSFGTFGTLASRIWGIYAAMGSGLVVANNTLTSYSGTNPCIQIGDNGLAVTDFAVSGNQVTCTASTVTGILIEDATIGSITGNTLHGALGTGSDGIHLLTSTIAVIGIAVNGNRVYNFATGIVETGSPTPDYNTYIGNNTHGCTAFMALTGTHDLPLNANTATLNITA